VGHDVAAFHDAELDSLTLFSIGRAVALREGGEATASPGQLGDLPLPSGAEPQKPNAPRQPVRQSVVRRRRPEDDFSTSEFTLKRRSMIQLAFP
jgi:hypothetical protein